MMEKQPNVMQKMAQNSSPTQNNGMQSSDQLSAQANHGGHEILDSQEILSGLTGVLDQFVMYQQYVKDPELQQILNKQYMFIANQYNRVVETCSTGQKPSAQATSYNMSETHDVVYGLQPSQPKKPANTVADINDQCISGIMLCQIKTLATGTTMAALEATNPVVRRVYADSVPNLIEMAYEMFLYQNKNQYYQVPQLSMQDQQQLQQAYGTYQASALGQSGQPPLQ